MTKNKPTRAAILEHAISLIKLDPATSASTNNAAVVASLKQEFKLSDFRARAVAARAARVKRYADFVKPNLSDDQIMLSPAEAARLTEADPQKISYPSIVRACQLGEIDAKQDESRHWTFSLAAFKAWRDDPERHRTGPRRSKNDNPVLK